MVVRHGRNTADLSTSLRSGRDDKGERRRFQREGLLNENRTKRGDDMCIPQRSLRPDSRPALCHLDRSAA